VTRKRQLRAVPATPVPEPVSLDAPPSDLSAAAQEFWRQVMGAFELERHHVVTLNLALHAWDRAEEARMIVDRDGMTVRDRFAQLRPHPMLAVERDARGQYARLMREVDLDGAAEPDVRPPRAPRNR
jgi:phage terminase small subunit